MLPVLFGVAIGFTLCGIIALAIKGGAPDEDLTAIGCVYLAIVGVAAAIYSLVVITKELFYQ